MKKVWSKIVTFSRNEIVCLLSLIVAVMYGMFYLDIRNPLQYSLSEIGRYNHALFIVWSVLSGLALLLNVHRFYARIGFVSKPGRFLLYGGLFFLVLTFLNMSKDPIYWYWIHVATAILFSLMSFASVALGLIYMWKKNKKYRILTSIFFGLILVDVILLAIFAQMALYEFIPLLLAYVVLFFTNFTDSFKVDLSK